MCKQWILILLIPLAAAILLRRAEFPRAAIPPVPNPPAHPALDAATALRALDDPATTRPTKPWLADLTQYTTENPGRWIIGKSATPSLTATEALTRARQAAAHSIDNLITPTVAHRGSESPWLHRRLAAAVAAGQFQQDQLIEQFNRPYGTVYTAAVLIDAAPTTLLPTVQRFDWDWTRAQRRIFRIRLAAAIAIVLGWLAYLILDTVTKGYFTTPLWLTAASINIAAIILLAA